ncbi:MAG: S41 family peptidase [Gammaproteobacteria bacterium]|jgi:carboxyl-terminal processing protease
MRHTFSRPVRALLGLALLGVLAAPAGHAADADKGDKSKAPATVDGLPLDEVRLFAQVMEQVRQAYVEPVDDKTLLRNAIRGMLSNLDPHSAYMDAEEFKQMQVTTTGRFGGLGLEVTMKDGMVTVISPIDDTPAAEAGIQPGDIILKVNEDSLSGLSLDQAVDLMRGEPGTDVTLTILRGDNAQPIELKLTRAEVRVSSVNRRLLEPDYGYLRISQFSEDTGDAVRKAVKRLEKDNQGRPLAGLVLDLRNNPGGVLDAAVDTADAFLSKGVIVTAKGRAEAANLERDARPGDLMAGAPIVVLVNGGSASASEIVAGALQDQGRALIMGTRTFGKGSVQTVIPLPEGQAIKITTARYFTPSGRSIQARGITPDVVVNPVQIQAARENAPMLRESELSGHLANPQAAGAPSGGAGPGEDRLLQSDYQLYEALTMLKGLHILDRRSAG